MNPLMALAKIRAASSSDSLTGGGGTPTPGGGSQAPDAGHGPLPLYGKRPGPNPRPGAFVGERGVIAAPKDPDVMGIPLSALTPKLPNQNPNLGIRPSNMTITPIMQRALEQIRRNIAPGA